MDAFVHFKQSNHARIVQLDRPKALHALNYDMAGAVLEQIAAWQKASDCRSIVLTSDNGLTKTPSFCAGGDVVEVATKLPVSKAKEYFEKEYQLNHLLGTSSKPVISIMDGIVMGGGAGLAVHGVVRVATERTRFAMPECAIGFFPDVGSSFFLPRIDPLKGGFALGRYLALTGRSLNGAECMAAGIATHFVPSWRCGELVDSIGELPLGSWAVRRPEAVQELDSLLHCFADAAAESSLDCDGVMAARTMMTSATRLDLIAKCFARGVDYKEQLSRMMAQSSDDGEWAAQVLEDLRKMSPTSLAITDELLKRGSESTFQQAFNREYQLACNVLEFGSDFREGVMAKLVRKCANPKWSEESVDLDKFFAINNHHMTFRNSVDYSQYPH